MKFQVVPTKQYKKDYRRLRKSGFDVKKIEHVIDLLSTGEHLPDRYRDHELKGELKGTRECHIGPDWLLHYQKHEDRLILFLISTGDHRHVLGIE